MKKVIKCLLIALILVVCMIGYTYAANECKVSVVTDKNEYNKDDQIIAEVKMSNINTRAGVMAIGGVVEYDKTSLKLEKIEGQNGWSPDINEQTGRLVAERGAPNKNDEVIMKLTFSINEGSKKNLTITIKEIQVGDGTALYEAIDDAKKEISIKDVIEPSSSPSTNPSNNPTIKPSNSPSSNPSNSPTNEPSNSPTNQPSNSPTNEPSNSPTNQPSNSPSTKPSSKPTDDKTGYNNGPLPQTGETTGVATLILSIVIGIVAIYFLARMVFISRIIK